MFDFVKMFIHGSTAAIMEEIPRDSEELVGSTLPLQR